MAEMQIDAQPHQQKFLDCNGHINEEGNLTDAIRIVFFGGGAKLR